MSNKIKRVIIEDDDVYIHRDLILLDITNKVPPNTILKKLRTARHREDY